MTQAKENDMILLHDCYGTSVEAALQIIDRLKEKGFEICDGRQIASALEIEEIYKMNEYSRTELLIGEEGLGRLKQATVMVFGVGGVGSHCIEALARSGAGRLILIDNDKVSLTNINRQSIAYHSTIGRMKTEVMRERIRDINPEIVVKDL